MMKKLLVALLAAALALCWCGTVTAEVTFDLPLTTDDIPLPEYMDPSVSDLTVEKTGDNEFTFSWKQSPMADAKSFSQYAWFDYETKNGGYEEVALGESDFVKTETGWSYTWEAPEDLVKNSLSFSYNWTAIDEDESQTDYSQTYQYLDGSYVYSKYYTTYEAGEYGSVSDGTGVFVRDGEIRSYTTKDGLSGNYQYGVLSSYSYWFENAFGAWQNIEFDAYGKPVSSTIWDIDIPSRSYEWYDWYGCWTYWEDGEEHYLDGDPEGAENPEAVKAPYANAIPQFAPPSTVSDTGFASKLSITADDLPTIESIEEKDGYWVVTVSGDLDKNDYKTDSTHKGVTDVVVEYRSPYGYWISAQFKYQGDHQEGNSYYFAIPEGAELDYPSVRFEVQDGATTYTFTKRDDGGFSVSAYTNDYFSSSANYNSDGVLTSVGYYNEETNSYSNWYFEDDGLLTSYSIEADDDLYITYLPDGTIDFASYETMIDNGDGSFSFDLIFWNAENGWHTETWDADKGEIIITPVDAPEGVRNPTAYPAPYVLAEKVQPHTWYPHNTVCVAGIEFRDAKPEVTNKWYNFAPIDLSQEGTQTFDLVASNMYVVGTVTVTRTGDEVVVDWNLRLQGTTDANFDSESEFLTFFSSLDAVTEVEPEWYDGPVYQFGEPISIEKDLGGDTNVLLYIRNTATYCNNLSYKYQRPIYQPRYDENSLGHRMMRDAMQAIMDADTVK